MKWGNGARVRSGWHELATGAARSGASNDFTRDCISKTSDGLSLCSFAISNGHQSTGCTIYQKS